MLLQTLLLLAVSFKTVCSENQSPNSPEVKLSHGGTVRGLRTEIQTQPPGTAKKSVDIFLGIPYAKPPLGDLRFAPPIKHEGWTGVRNTVKYPPTCWQFIAAGFDLKNKGAAMWVNNTDMDEDCLYLNVWTPSAEGSTAKLPVMVWIYGGGFTSGTSTLTTYSGDILTAKHDVVFVSMQYRVGAFGFIRMDPNSDGSSSNLALGNMGLKDQLLALEWVKQEITAFGGDPEKITVFGESAGAVSVSALWVSPKTNGLFKRAILQSSSVLARWGLHDSKTANHRSSVFAKACGCPDPSTQREESVKCLQNVDPLILVNSLDSINVDEAHQRNQTMWEAFFSKMTEEEFGAGPYPGWATTSRLYFDCPFSVVIDGDLLPKDPLQIIQSDQFKTNTELLIGVNEDEGMYFLLYGLGIEGASFLKDTGDVVLPQSIIDAGLRKPRPADNQRADFQWLTALQILDKSFMIPGLQTIPVSFYGLPMKLNTSEEYGDPNDMKLSGEEIMKRLSDMTGDLDFICHTLNFADHVSRRKDAKVFVYYFAQTSSQLPWPKWTGVMHGYEIPFVFGMPHLADFTNNFYTFTKEETQFSDEMQKLWVQFATNGNPNGNGVDDWPQYKSNSDPTKKPGEADHYVLNTTMRPGNRLHEQGCALWLQLMEAERKILMKGNSQSISAPRRTLAALPLSFIQLLMMMIYR